MQITADYTKLEQDHVDAAHYYLHRAVDSIDELLGDNYAAEHPILVAAYMQAAGQDCRAAYEKLAAQDIAAGLQRIADALSENFIPRRL